MQASSSRSVSRPSSAKGWIAQHRLIDPLCPMCCRGRRLASSGCGRPAPGTSSRLHMPHGHIFEVLNSLMMGITATQSRPR